ncbi:MAG: AAA family ATPase [Alphaproteobacteria bacterium]|nr:AAA family ATPase [Alphaproteobacteria bacterium]
MIVPLPHQQKLPLKGQEVAKKNFEQALRAKKLSQAIILYGPKGIGKATAAFSFAKQLLMQQNATSLDSHYLQQLDALIYNLAHPDLLYIAPQRDEEKKTKKMEITVEEVRQIKQFLSLTPSISLWKVVIIDSTNDLNRSASNALLKVLEEPPPFSIFFLITHNLGQVLPTIRSRCHKMAFAKLDPVLIRELLSSINPESSEKIQEKIITLADGSIGKALAILNENILETQQYITNFLERSGSKDYISIQKFLENHPSSFITITDMLLAWMHQQALMIIKENKYKQNNTSDSHNILGLIRLSNAYQECVQFITSSLLLNLDQKQSLISLFTLVENALSLTKTQEKLIINEKS